MSQVKKELLVLFGQSVVEAKNRINIPGNPQTQSFRISHVAKIEICEPVPNTTGINEGNRTESKMLV